MMTRLYHLESQTIIRDIVKSFLFEDGIYSYVGADPIEVDFLKDGPMQSIDVLLLGFNNDEPMAGKCSMFEICKNVKKNFPAIQIVAHSAYSSKGHFVQLIKAGVSAIVSKREGIMEFKRALNEIRLGRQYVNETCKDIVLNPHQFAAGEKAKVKYDGGLFSERELEVLTLVAQGYRTHQIAQSLFIAPKTVETHRKSLVVKSSTKNTAEMISYSYSHGLL